MISASSEVLIDEIEWIPSEKDCLVESLSFTVSSKSLVSKLSDIKVDCRLKAFLFHPGTTIACKGERVSTDSFELVDDFSAC